MVVWTGSTVLQFGKNDQFCKFSQCKFSHQVRNHDTKVQYRDIIPKQRSKTLFLLLSKTISISMCYVLWEHSYCCCIYTKAESNRSKLFKGNPNFWSILNWILQILLYHCRKQHKNFENFQFIEQNIMSFCPSLCLLRLMLPLPFSMADIFQFLDTVLSTILASHVIICAVV